MEEFLNQEDGDYKKIFAVLRSLEWLQEYAEAFKEEKMSDDEVEFCIENNAVAELGNVIGAAGHRIKFLKRFKEYFQPVVTVSAQGAAGPIHGAVPAQAQLVSDGSGDQQSDWVKNMPIPDQPSCPMFFPVDNPPPYPGHACSGQGSAGDHAQAQVCPTPSANPDPWKRIVESLNLKVTAKVSILKNVRAKALERYQGRVDEAFSVPLKSLAEEELNQVKDEAEDRAYAFIQEILQGVDAPHIEATEKSLNDSFVKCFKDLLKRNEKQKTDCKKEVDEIAAKICVEFVSAVKKEVGHSLIDRETFDSVLEDCKEAAETDFVESCQNLEFFNPEVLSKKIQTAANKLWTEIEKNNKLLRQRRDKAILNAVKMYETTIATCCSADDFEDCHTTAVEKGMEVVKDLDLNESFKEIILEELETRMNEELKGTAETKLVERIEKAEAEIQDLISTSTATYLDKMKGIKNSINPILEETLLNKHVHAKKEVLMKIADTFQKIEKHVKQPASKQEEILVQTECELEKEYLQIECQNRASWEAYEDNAKAVVEQLKTLYSKEIQTFMNATSQKDFESKEQNLRKSVEQKFTESVNKKVAKPEFFNAMWSNILESINMEKKGVMDVFSLKQREDELAVKSALHEAKRYYSDEMDTRFKAKPWYEEADLKRVHDSVFEMALKACSDVIELTEHQAELLQEAFEAVYKRYSDENKCRSPKAEPAIGIDLGTTYCCVGIYLRDKVQIIPNVDYDAEKTTVPSYVAFNDDGNIDIGHVARERAYANAQHTIFDAKRLIGRKFDDPIVQRDLELWPFDVIGVENEPRIVARGKNIRPEEISAKVLAKLKGMAEKYLNKKVKNAVITVPAYFNGSQRQATKDAAEIAGLNAFIMNEPTAAAVAYKLNSTGDLKKNVVVFDLGGGTFDIAVIQMQKGNIQVLGIGGDTHLGGEDFDHNLVEEIIRRVRNETGIDLSEGKDSLNLVEKLETRGRLRRLRYVCEQEKRRLAVCPYVTIRLENLHDELPILEERITREDFYKLNMSLFEKCIESVADTLEKAGVPKEKVDDIVLVGGSTRILKIQEMLRSFFGGKKELIKTLDADEAVAIGAAYEAAIRFADQTNVKRSSAVRGIKDVTPLSLGVAVHPDKMSVIIPKNSEIPCVVKKDGFTTLLDNQTSCDIRIFEGEHDNVKKNVQLGNFKLTGIPLGPAGREKMECTMEIDDEGILHVQAQVVTNGKVGNLKIEKYNGRMSKNEIKFAMGQELLRWS